MELDELKKIKSALPTQSGIVEIRYRNAHGNYETKPGYFVEIFDTPIDEIPEMWREQFNREHTELPFIELYTFLDRNQCPKEPLEIRVQDIENVWPSAIVSLKSK